MMASIFLIFVFAQIAIFFRYRTMAITLVFLGLLATLAMFWHHATDMLKINL